ncbi:MULTISPECIES: MbcA/ParS/Xre antitoxin family protein [Legionella]|uniref:Uncharacterized protein n=1 Tax=Legionella maceachernii TaxID=466 RepID=A0A0W0VZ67_9GAMM|nr:MbcA/ParS/Xre antitoxin family protein [Legionella maceachernii]KTD25214.1 hypothetical protein Lmac_2192 [Legionella maceachernii]SJZ76545.1 Protein of unknown function [Legionella maceachernii]SUP03104.1 Protein of uncharacterised function (DUF2384) [Legionella maceachernii]
MIRPKKITEISGHQVHTAFKAVLNILRKWHCTTEEMQILLGLKRSTLFKYKSMPEKASISHDLTERLSYLLNIHAALRILFSNPDSVYGWVRKPNRAPFFNGKSAMDIMLQGRVVDLWAVASRLNAERGGKS